MREEVKEWLNKPVLTDRDVAVLQFCPRAIVHGLQIIGLTLKEQLDILSAILEWYGSKLDEVRKNYLAFQIAALKQHCAM